MILCPECGAHSPEESVYCDNCGATLLPAGATGVGSAISGGGNTESRKLDPASLVQRSAREKTPEWLKALEDPWDEGLIAQSATSPADEDPLVPHWLRGPEFEAPLAADGSAGGAPEPAGPGEIPIWLREFDLPPDGQPAGAEQNGDGLTPKWLAHLEPDQTFADETGADEAAADGAPEPAEIVDAGLLAAAITRAPEEQPEAMSAMDSAPSETVEPEESVEPAQSIPEWLRVLDIAAIQATLLSPAEARELGLMQPEVPEPAAADELPAAMGEEPELEPENERAEPASVNDAPVDGVAEASVAAAIQEEEADEFTSWLRALTMTAAVRGVAASQSNAAGPVDERSRLLAEVDELFYGASGAADEMETVDPLPQWLDEVLRSVDEFSGEGDAAAIVAGEAWLDEGGGLPADGRPGAGTTLAGAAMLAAGGALVGERNGAPAPGVDAAGLVEAELPEWLAVAGQEAFPEMGRLAAATAVAERGPLAGIPGVLEREPEVYELQPAGVAAEPALSPEQRQQLAVLQQLGVAEQEPVAGTTQPGHRQLSAWLQPVVALLLLAVIVIGLLYPRPVEIVPSAMAAAETLSAAVAATAGRPVLVAFEYSPAMAGELSPLAGVLLADLAANGSAALLVSQSAAGITLGENLAAQTAGLSSSSVGYLPGEVIGLRQLAGCLSDPAACETLAGEPVDESLKQQLAGVALIVVLAADRDGLVSWVEQVSPVVDAPMHAGVTQAAAPLAAPYQGSGQLASVLAGYPAAVAYEQLMRGAEAALGPIASQAWAYTLALWLGVGVLVAGAIYWLAGKAKRRGGGSAQ